MTTGPNGCGLLSAPATFPTACLSCGRRSPRCSPPCTASPPRAARCSSPPAPSRPSTCCCAARSRPGSPSSPRTRPIPGFIDALHRCGARPVGVPPGDIARLADAVAAHRPALAYLIPSTRTRPAGAARRRAARDRGAAAAASGRHVHRRHDDSGAPAGRGPLDWRQQPPPLAALASRLPNVVTVGSLSKTYWGGLRTGWVRAPAGIIARLAAAKAAADLGSPPHAAGPHGGADPRSARGDRCLPGRLGAAALRRHGGGAHRRSCPTGSGRRRRAG